MAKNLFNADGENPRISEIQREVKSRLETAADADAEMSRKAKVTERKIDALEIELPKEQGILERMKRDCRELQEKIRAEKMKAADEAEAQLRADVQSGKIGVVQFHEAMAEHQRKTKAEIENSDSEIVEVLMATRAKGLTVLEMADALAEHKMNFYHYLGYPTETALTEIGKMVQEMSHRSQAIAGHYQNAMAEHEQAKFAVERAKGKALIAGCSKDNLSLDEIKNLPFDPQIPKKYLPSLAVITLEIEQNEKKRTAAFQDAGQYYLAVSYMMGLTQPWTWLCRNDASPALAMNRQKMAAGLTMSGIEAKSKLEV